MSVAIVTGSNKGIGFGIVRDLCRKYVGDVYLTSRNEERGLKAVEDLRKEGLDPKYHVCDLANMETIYKLREGKLKLDLKTRRISIRSSSTV